VKDGVRYGNQAGRLAYQNFGKASGKSDNLYEAQDQARPCVIMAVGNLLLLSTCCHDITQAKRLKNEAASRPELYQVCVDVGNWTHRATAWITVTSAGHKSIGVSDIGPFK
jgi:hypothetical protein